MALANLGNNNGLIYLVDDAGNILGTETNSLWGLHNLVLFMQIESSTVLSADNQRPTYSTWASFNVKLDSSPTAPQGDHSAAIDITSYILKQSMSGKLPTEAITIVSGVATYKRWNVITYITLDTESAAATDNLTSFVETLGAIAIGDIIILRGADAAKVTTIQSGSGIVLNGGVDFLTDDVNRIIMLTYDGTNWNEMNRSNTPIINDVAMRANGVNFGIKGAEVNTVVLGAAKSLVNDTNSKIQYVEGTVSGTGDWTLHLPTGPTPKDGDVFIAEYRANVTTTGAVTLLGLELTDKEAQNGTTKPITVVLTYMDSAWKRAIKISDADALEADLGLPTANSQVLSSNTLGERAWVEPVRGVGVVKFSYDVAVNGGTIGVYTLGDPTNVIPRDAIIDGSLCMVQTETALAGAAGATVKIGVMPTSTSGAYIATDDDFVLTDRLFSASPYSTEGLASRGVDNIGMISSVTKITVEVSTAALTAGKFNVFIAYYK